MQKNIQQDLNRLIFIMINSMIAFPFFIVNFLVLKGLTDWDLLIFSFLLSLELLLFYSIFKSLKNYMFYIPLAFIVGFYLFSGVTLLLNVAEDGYGLDFDKKIEVKKEDFLEEQKLSPSLELLLKDSKYQFFELPEATPLDARHYSIEFNVNDKDLKKSEEKNKTLLSIWSVFIFSFTNIGFIFIFLIIGMILGVVRVFIFIKSLFFLEKSKDLKN